MKKRGEILTRRRKELGLCANEVARRIGINSQWYRDVEVTTRGHDDEITTTLHMQEVRKLCSVLKLDFFEMFDLPCAFCMEGEAYKDEYKLPRNEVVRMKREGLKLSHDELGDKVGFYSIAIEKMEETEDYIETWGAIENIEELAKELNVPSQILLGVKCPKCGR